MLKQVWRCARLIADFAFCVSVIILNADGSKIVRLHRKEACYCRLPHAALILALYGKVINPSDKFASNLKELWIIQ